MLAGVLLGLGVAAKLYPLLLLGALFLLCLRAGRLRAWLRTAVAAGGGLAGGGRADRPAGAGQLGRFFRLNRQPAGRPRHDLEPAPARRRPRLLDGPLAPGQTPTVLNAVVAVLLLVLLAAGGGLADAAPRRCGRGWPQLAFLLVAGFLLLNKVWSPQYSLWLLPLAVLARPRWRSLLLWQATEALLWVPRMLWYLGTDEPGVGVEWFFLAVRHPRPRRRSSLMGLVVRDVLRPDGDVVRTSWPGIDDPAGGVLDGARRTLVTVLGRRQPAECAA